MATPAEASRVVSLTPAATAIIYGLGRGESLVGVTRYCATPDGSKIPIVGDMSVRLEAVMAQQPDLVVIGEYASQTKLRQQLKAMNLNVRALPLTTLGELRAAIGALGQALDAEDAAARLVDAFDASAATARARAAVRAQTRPEKPRVLLVFDVGNGVVYTTGGRDHLGEILALNGAINIADGGPVTTRLPLEAVLARDPDVIIHVAPSDAFPNDEAARRWWSELKGLRAAKAGAVYVWPNDHLAQNGPQTAQAIIDLATLLDGLATADGLVPDPPGTGSRPR